MLFNEYSLKTFIKTTKIITISKTVTFISVWLLITMMISMTINQNKWLYAARCVNKHHSSSSFIVISSQNFSTPKSPARENCEISRFLPIMRI